MAEQDLIVQEETFLGLVLHVQPGRGGGTPEFCRLRPTHHWTPGGWSELRDAKSMFPDTGSVFWFRPKLPLRVNQAVVFQVGVNPSYEARGGKREKYQVPVATMPVLPMQAISLPADMDDDDLRQALAEAELQIQEAPVCTHILLQTVSSEKRWIGPFELAPHSQGGTLRIRADDSGGHGLARVRIIPSEKLHEVNWGGRICRLLSFPDSLPEHSGYFVTQSDSELIKSVIERTKTLQPEYGDAVGAAENLLQTYLRSSQASGMKKRDLLREAARQDAAMALVSKLRDGHVQSQRLNAIVDGLLTVPDVKAQLKQLQESEAEKVRREAADKMEAELASARATLNALRLTEGALKAQISQLSQGIEDATEKLLANNAAKLMEHVVVRALIKARPTSGTSEPRMAVGQRKLRGLRDPRDFKSAAMLSSAVHGVDPYVMQVTAGLLVGARLLLLGGQSAGRMATAIASVLAVEACRVQVTAATFGIEDLLRCPSVIKGDGGSRAVQLGSFLARREKSEGFRVVILQGCNRAPIESVVADVAEIAHAQEPLRNVGWSDTAGQMHDSYIDRQTLFIGTLLPGPSVFPVPSMIRHQLAVYWADRLTAPGVTIDAPTDIDDCAIAPDFAARILSAHEAHSAQGYGAFQKAIEGLPAEVDLAHRVACATALLGKDDIAYGETLGSLLVGRIEEERLQSLYEQLPLPVRNCLQACIRESSPLHTFFQRG